MNTFCKLEGGCINSVQCNHLKLCSSEYVRGFEPTIKTLTGEIVEWADGVFPDRLPEHAFAKMIEEVEEWSKRPSDGHEAADVMILMLDVCHLAGIDIAKAVRWKMRINHKREWGFDKNGLLQHIKEKDNGQHDT